MRHKKKLKKIKKKKKKMRSVQPAIMKLGRNIFLNKKNNKIILKMSYHGYVINSLPSKSEKWYYYHIFAIFPKEELLIAKL